MAELRGLFKVKPAGNRLEFGAETSAAAFGFGLAFDHQVRHWRTAV